MFLEGIRAGNTHVVSALVAGLQPDAVAKWCLVGSGQLAHDSWRKGVYRDLVRAVARAEAEHEAAMVAVVRETATADVKDSWRAAAWLLDHSAKTAPPVPENEDDDELAELSAAVLDAEE
jgi:hypothetical protein